MSSDRLLSLVQILSGFSGLTKERRLLEVTAFHRSICGQTIELIYCNASFLRDRKDWLVVLLDNRHNSVSVIRLGVLEVITVSNWRVSHLWASTSNGILLDDWLAINHVFEGGEVSFHALHVARWLSWRNAPLSVLIIFLSSILSLCVELRRLHIFVHINNTGINWDDVFPLE